MSTSHIIASSHPPPSAYPATAATVGVRVAANLAHGAKKSTAKTSANDSSDISLMSAPAANAFSLPVMMAWHVHVREQHLHIRAGFEEPQRLLSFVLSRTVKPASGGRQPRACARALRPRRGESREDCPSMMLPTWSFRVPQPAVIPTLDASACEGPGTAMTRRAERTNSYDESGQTAISGRDHRAVLRSGSNSQRPPSLGGVLERGGFLTARLVQGLCLVLIRIARGLDGPLGISH